MAFFPLFYCLDFFHPYESWPLFSGGGGGGGGRIFLWRIFWTNFDFFLSCLEVVLKLFGDCFWT